MTKNKQFGLLRKPSINQNIVKFSKPKYIITVDTEEEFDWDRPFSREQHGLDHVPAIDRFQKLCDKNNVKPIYLVDYPIVNNPQAVEIIKQYCDSDTADVGIQLHPWVNPPFNEDVTNYNSYSCNLPPDLERLKLTNLCDLIAQKFDVNPSIYRAGRYGAGTNTVSILNDLGVKIDTSVRTRFSYTSQHGPDYSKFPINPYWITERKLLELPVTSVFTGLFGNASDMIYNDIFGSKLARSLLSRTNLIERIALTPEGTPLNKAIDGVNRALKEGVEILNFSFHSPSLAAGYTPYVRTEEDLQNFYLWWETMFTHLANKQVSATSLDEIIALYYGK